MSRLPLVKIGIVGLGSEWLENLCPAIDRMRSRIRVVGVYDDVSVAAHEWAGRSQAKVILGVRSLLARKDIDAVLLGAIGWQGPWLLDLLRKRELPILLGPDVSLSRQQLDEWHNVSVDEGLIVIPELRLRYLPATLRLRELQATSLGPVKRLTLHPQAWNRFWERPVPLSHLLDWCASLIERPPAAVEPAPGRSPDDGKQGEKILFERRSAATVAGRVEAFLATDRSRQHRQDVSADVPLCELDCEQGTAVIVGPNELRWSSAADSGHESPTRESLTAERSSTEVSLDLFARRVLGGLIPTPDLGDLRRAHALADAVQCARQTGRRVAL